MIFQSLELYIKASMCAETLLNCESGETYTTKKIYISIRKKLPCFFLEASAFLDQKRYQHPEEAGLQRRKSACSDSFLWRKS
jgi:hypothetical protein